MQPRNITLIFETRQGEEWPRIPELFLEHVKVHYPKANLKAGFAPIDDNFESFLEESHDLAAQAEMAQKDTGEDLVAQVRPISLTFEHSVTKETIPGGIALIAVAHPRGVGAFAVTHTLPLNLIPTRAKARVLEVISEIQNVMRPRSKYEENEAARLLAQSIVDVFEQIVSKLR